MPRETSKEIWIVDDEPAICRALSRWLKARGREVRTFADSPAVDAALARHPLPALLIVDARLDHRATILWMQSMRRSLPEIPLVLMSANIAQYRLDQLMRDKIVDAFLEKPWEDAALAGLIQKLAA